MVSLAGARFRKVPDQRSQPSSLLNRLARPISVPVVAVAAAPPGAPGRRLAERVLQVDKSDPIARLVLGVRAIKQKQYPVSRRELTQSIRGPITDLAATLLSAWTMANPSEAKQATDSMDKLTGADWYAIFKDLHAALILDVAGQKKEAAKRFERAYKLDATALRVVQSYGSFLSRQGNTTEALKVFATFDEALPRHPLIVEATNELKAGKKLPLVVDTPQAGAAEVFFGLGAALGRSGGEDLGLIYLQLSLYLAPSHPLALLALGDFYERPLGRTVTASSKSRIRAARPSCVIGFWIISTPGSSRPWWTMAFRE